MSGVFVPVVGPSGAGKDTLIAAARSRFAGDDRIVFVRRTVTRPEGGNEDHDTLDPAAFADRRRAGAYVLSWGAHGLYYGIPATALADVRAGRVVVANLSRFPQPVELDLRRFEGRRPVELLGGVPFPEIGELPYLLTLAGYGFYWFRLTAPETTEEGLLL